jgi:hypothetical protein
MSDTRRFYEAQDSGKRRSAPAVARNRVPITEVLHEWLPPSGLVLELASGTGEHAVAFATAFPALDWQPSDIHLDAVASIVEWRSEAGLANLRPPLVIDAVAEWPIDEAAAVLSINMVHISPWNSALGLIAGAAKVLSPGAPLIIYGPWLQQGVEPAPSNLAFDADLRRRDPAWGLRSVEDFAAAAKQWFDLEATRQMPANNLMLLFRRTACRR